MQDERDENKPGGSRESAKDFEDDPDAPARSDDVRAALSLREAIQETEDALAKERPAAFRAQEARWLAAHLRFPTELDSIGEVRARGLARAAREAVQTRRSQAEMRAFSVRRFRRFASGTGGLIAGAVAVLVFVWFVVGKGNDSLPSPSRPAPMQTAWLVRDSIKRKESPSVRLDLLIQARLRKRQTGVSPKPSTLMNRHHRVSSHGASAKGAKPSENWL
ncbi:MAG TPA: hypothetical protein PKE31_15395 [Pseudomonadota bacterium]|nr:hypothetical protein [Pseudomonadota bacterium]